MYLATATVQKIDTVARDCFSLCLKEPWIANNAVPGQFVHVRISPGLYPLLRRPFSIAETMPKRGEFRLLIRAVGEGTRCLQKIQAGQSLDCLGPLGSGFIPQRTSSVLVAGGIGVAPLIFLAQSLACEKHAVSLYYGTASVEDRVPLHLWLPDSVEQIDVTEDGSAGLTGRVTQVLQRDVQEKSKPGALFACGPAPMLRELVTLNAAWDIPMQISLEERMACGTGACQGCVVEIEGDEETEFLRVCREGPVFDARKVVDLRAGITC